MRFKLRYAYCPVCDDMVKVRPGYDYWECKGCKYAENTNPNPLRLVRRRTGMGIMKSFIQGMKFKITPN